MVSHMMKVGCDDLLLYGTLLAVSDIKIWKHN
jgi:hypothetical protein